MLYLHTSISTNGTVAALETEFVKLLLRFAFNFNLRRYKLADAQESVPGSVVHVDSIKTRVKSNQQLKLEYHKLLSSFAFNGNLRRYDKDLKKCEPQENLSANGTMVGRCRLTPG
jgi:hypothetical protein